MSTPAPDAQPSAPVTPAPAKVVGGIVLHAPGLKVPSGTIYNDLIALAVAVVAILRAFGII